MRCKLTHILFFDAGNDGGSLGLPLNDIADVLDLFSLPIVGPLATAAAAAAAGMPQPMAADGLRWAAPVRPPAARPRPSAPRSRPSFELGQP